MRTHNRLIVVFLRTPTFINHLSTFLPVQIVLYIVPPTEARSFDDKIDL